jgi:hypothetical protein
MGLFNWRARLHEGLVIPAHPLALTAARKLHEERQRGLTRYYLDSGAGRNRRRSPHYAVRHPRLRPV